MRLLTKELIKRFKEVGSQENNPDPLVIAKFFNPTGQATWLATEYNEQERIFWGYASLFNDPALNEFGTFSLDELESLRLPLGLKIERDLWFKEKPLSKAKKENNIY